MGVGVMFYVLREDTGREPARPRGLQHHVSFPVKVQGVLTSVICHLQWWPAFPAGKLEGLVTLPTEATHLVQLR